MFGYVTPEMAGISWISVGMNYFINDAVSVNLRQRAQGADYKKSYAPIFNMLEDRKARWLEAAKDKPSLYQYLKKNIHTNKE
jgi:hypothetical protein